MERERFEELVDRAVEGLPELFQERMENIAILVEDWPTPHQLEEAGVKRPQDLLGLYEGVPFPHRDSGYNMVLPDRITIFQKSIEMYESSDEAVVRRIQRTVRHEVAHYFGISDERLKEIDRY